MVLEARKEELRKLESEFEYYVKKVRGFMTAGSSIEVVILWEEFKEQRARGSNNNDQMQDMQQATH